MNVAAKSPVNARRVVERFFEVARNQCDFPYSARMIPEFQDPTRRETRASRQRSRKS